MTVTTEIATRNENQVPAMSAQSFGLEGMEGLGPQDVILPRYTIVQPTSQNKGDVPGLFHNNLTNEVVPTVKAVILKISPARTLWSGDLADKRPQCSSHNGVSGRNTDGETPLCATCQFNRWATDKDDKVCRAGYLYLCVNVEDESMFLLGAMGTSVKAAKILTSLFVNKKRPPFSAIVEFATQKVEDPAKGKYWILKPAVIEWLDVAKTAEYRETYKAMQGVAIHEVEPEGETTTDSDEMPF